MIFKYSLRIAILPRAIALLAVLAAVCASPAAGQERSQYDRGTPPQHAAGVSSFGSYASSDLGTVNLSNGALNFNIPLGQVGGRGFSVPLTLNYTSKVWSAGAGSDDDNSQDSGPITRKVVYASYDDALGDYYSKIAPGWSIGAQPLLKAQRIGIGTSTNGLPHYTLTKLSMVMPGGGEVELRDDWTDGAPIPVPQNATYTYMDGYRGRRWHATDGSGLIFISDGEPGPAQGAMSGTVITADGTRYRFEDGGTAGAIPGSRLARCQRITDRNGNYIQISYPASNELTYTDQLGRITKVQWDMPDPAAPHLTLDLLVTFPGYRGQPRYYKVRGGLMNQHYRADITPELPVITGDKDSDIAPHGYATTGTKLFPDSWGKYRQNIDSAGVISELELPDGRSLRFKYNEYGEVAEVVMPTGGKVQYDYSSFQFLPAGETPNWEKSAQEPNMDSAVWGIDRGLALRRSYPDGSTLKSTWGYNYGVCGTDACATVVAHEGTAEGPKLLDEAHYFPRPHRYYYQNGDASDGTGYTSWWTGVEKRTEVRDASGTAVISATEQDWAPRANVSWTTGYAQEQPANDNRVNEQRKFLDDGKTARTTYQYDAFNNPRQVREYDFDGSLKRCAATSYLSVNDVNGVDYTGDSYRLLRLASEQSLYEGECGDSSKEKSRTTYQYDRYVADGNDAPLQTYNSVSGHDAANYDAQRSARGNATRAGRWHKEGNTTLYAFSRFDVLGNVVSAKDGRGNVSTVSFSDDFGAGASPDGNNPDAGSVPGSGQTYALPTLITGPPPNAGAQPHTARSQYDYWTGLLTGFRDRNGTITQTIYDDQFNRPTLVKTALGIAGLESHTAMYYAPGVAHGVTLAAGDVLTASDLNTAGDASLVEWTKTDGFGRTAEAWQRDPQGDVSVKTIYDALGRAQFVSNPARPGAPSTTDGWTRTTFDLAGRVKEAASFKGALTQTPPATGTSTDWTGSVATSYVGNEVSVTDQDGKKRSSLTDALGRLTQVVEAPGVTDYGYETKYEYDAPGNLTKVIQGKAGQVQQTRTFIYDSLSRLTSAQNPESGTVTYEYDANDNLRKKVDARQVQTDYEYDALNRIFKRSYAIVAGQPTPPNYTAAPAVDYFYDGRGMPAGTTAPLSAVGRLTAVKSPVSHTLYTEFDQVGRVRKHRQVSEPGTAAEQPYEMEYGYNLAGALTSQKYPSGRVVKTEYDGAGRIAGVQNQATGNYYAGAASSNPTDGIRYAAHGAVSAMKLGNGLWEVMQYNSRLQAEWIKLGTTNGGIDRWQLEYGYGTAGQNNGNVRSQTITVPTIGTVTGFTATQTYTYDALNRIETATEAGGASWKQKFIYDDFGNRTIDPDQERTSPWLVGPNPAINPANNRISAASYGYDLAGNLTATPGVNVSYNYEYDAENRQTQYKYGSTTEATYAYDGDGRRVRKYVTASGATTIFVYNVLGQMMAEYSTKAADERKGTQYLTSDHLGTPRVITGADGAVRGRHDYLPFGEELFANMGGRTTGQGYAEQFGVKDGVRQQFTGKERDNETGLDYFEARYYSSTQGRFTSPDEFTGGPTELFAEVAAHNPTFYADFLQPQSLNKYQYCLNNPLKFVDPDGHQEAVADFLKWGAQQVSRSGIPQIQKAAVVIEGAAALVYVMSRGDNTQGDGSCPSCDGFNNAMRQRREREADAHRSQAQDGTPKEVTVDANKHPESAQHIEDAQKAGKPGTLTVDRGGAKDRRRESLRGTPTTKGKDRDEYPPAVTKEGGKGASVRPISPRDNRGSGSSIGRQLRGVPNGTKIKIKVTRKTE